MSSDSFDQDHGPLGLLGAAVPVLGVFGASRAPQVQEAEAGLQAEAPPAAAAGGGALAAGGGAPAAAVVVGGRGVVQVPLGALGPVTCSTAGGYLIGSDWPVTMNPLKRRTGSSRVLERIL